MIEPDLGPDPYPRGSHPGLDVLGAVEEGHRGVGGVAGGGDGEAADGARGDVAPEVGVREPLVETVAQRRGVEQVVDEPGLMIRVALDDVRRLLQHRVARAFHAQHFRPAGDAAQRRAQFVR